MHTREERFYTVPRQRWAGAGSGAQQCDVDEQGEGVVSVQRLHQLIRQPGGIADRTFEPEFLDPGVEGYAFTFG